MVKKNVALLDLESNPNIGLYLFANDKFCLIGPQITERKKEQIEKVLGVNVYKTTALGTDLLGIFFAGNNEVLIIPELNDYEEEEILKITKKYDVKLIKIKSRLNTFGNNLCFANKSFLFNPEYSKETIDSISKKTGCKSQKLLNKEFNIAGAICKCINDSCFISQEIEEKEVGFFSKILKGAGTLNSGSNTVASGVVGNSKGLLIGSSSSTVEIQNLVESLDYL